MSRPAKRARAAAEPDAAELALQRELFGDAPAAPPAAASEPDEPAAGAAGAGAPAAAAWVDEDDAALRVDVAGVDRLRKLRQTEEEEELTGAEYEARLRARFAQTQPQQPAWASLEARARTEDDDDEHDPLASSAPLLARDGSSRPLPAGRLDVTRAEDGNAAERAKSVVHSVGFHANGALLFAAGLDKTLRLFHVDGQTSRKVQSVFVDDLPIWHAEMVGDEVLLAGRRPFFAVYDVESGAATRVPRIMGRRERSLETFAASEAAGLAAFAGNGGTAILVSLKTKQWVGDLHMNGSLRALRFSPDGQELLTTGGDGEVYVWDLRARRCRRRHRDQGSTGGSSLACAPGMYAVGSESGVVNLYAGSAPDEPVRAFDNLTTAADCLEFSPDGQILAMSSHRKKDALRVVHVPSRTVFSNWPTQQTPLRFVRCMAFSPRGGFLAAGNDRGRVLLYRLNHYSSA